MKVPRDRLRATSKLFQQAKQVRNLLPEALLDELSAKYRARKIQSSQPAKTLLSLNQLVGARPSQLQEITGISGVIRSSKDATVLDPIVCTNRPNLQRLHEEILEHIIESNKNHDPYLKAYLASGKRTSFSLIDSNAVNAACIESLGRIFSNLGTLKTAYREFGDKGAKHWLMWVKSHEVAHIIYEQAMQDSNRRATALAMEYMCDKIGAMLFYRAGGDTKYLTFRPLGPIDSTRMASIPGLSSHPGHYSRETELERIKVEQIYNVNREPIELLSKPLTEDEKRELIETEAKYEFVSRLTQIQPAECTRIEMGILKCCDILERAAKQSGESKETLKQQTSEVLDAITNISGTTRTFLRFAFNSQIAEENFAYSHNEPINNECEYYRTREFRELREVGFSGIKQVLADLPSLIEFFCQESLGEFASSKFPQSLKFAFTRLLDPLKASSSQEIQDAFEISKLFLYNGIELATWYDDYTKDTDYKHATQYRSDEEIRERKIHYKHSPELVSALCELANQEDLYSLQCILENMSERNICLFVQAVPANKIKQFTKNPYLARTVGERFNTKQVVEQLLLSSKKTHVAFWIERLRALGDGDTNDLNPEVLKDKLSALTKKIDEVYDKPEDKGNRELLKNRLGEAFQLSWLKRERPLPTVEDLNELAKAIPNITIDRKSPLAGFYQKLSASDIVKIAPLVNRGFEPNNSSKEYLYPRIQSLLQRQFTISVDPPETVNVRVNYHLGAEYKKRSERSNEYNQSADWLQKRYNSKLNVLLEPSTENGLIAYRALVACSSPAQQIALFDKYIASTGGQITEETIDLFKGLMERTRGLKVEITPSQAKPLLSEAVGIGKQWKEWSEENEHQISARDYIYLRYFQQNFEIFTQKTDAEIVEWIKQYFPLKSAYRDVVLNKIFNHGRFELITERSLQKEILGLYRDDARAIKLKSSYLQTALEESETLDEKINYIRDIFPYPSEDRDRLLEQAFSEHPFRINDLKGKYDGLFSYSQIQRIRDNKAIDSTLESIISRQTAEDKAGVILWLAGIKADLPTALQKQEKKHGVDLRELKALFRFEGLRGKALEQAFAGSNGLFSSDNKAVLRQFLEDSLGQFFILESDDSVAPKDKSAKDKLKILFKEALYTTFESESVIKKLRIIKSLFTRLLDERAKNMNFEDLCQVFLSSSGPVGIKFAQVLSSQVAIKDTFPELYEKLSQLKDEASEITMYEVERAIETNPELANKEIVVLQTLGSASMKTTKLVTVDGEELVMKIRRINADKNLDIEQADFIRTINKLQPLLEEFFGVKNIPDYSQRIFEDIVEESNLLIEKANAGKLGQFMQRFNQSGLTPGVLFSVPEVKYYSNEVIMFEKRADGVPFADWTETADDAASAKVKEAISRCFIYSIPQFFHADPHDRNIFTADEDLLTADARVVQKPNGQTEVLVSWIDLGLCQQTPAISGPFADLIKDSEFTDLVRDLNANDWEVLMTLVTDPEVSASIGDIVQQFKGRSGLGLTMAGIGLVRILGNKNIFSNGMQAVDKIIRFFGLLNKHELLDSLQSLPGGVTYKNLIEILKKCSARNSARDIPLAIVSELDSIPDYRMPKFILRLLLALSKSPYTLEYIKSDPRRTFTELLLATAQASKANN